MKKLIAGLVGIILLASLGCSQAIKWDRQAYKENKAFAQQQLKTWSFNSGFYTCAMMGEPITFPTTVRNYVELNRLMQNPSVLTGMIRLDELAKRRGVWSDEDYDLGCFEGTSIRMTVSQVLQAIRTFYPQAAPYLPSFEK